MESTTAATAAAAAATGLKEEQDLTLSEALDLWVAKIPDKRLWTYLDDAGRETSDSITYRQMAQKTAALGRSLLAGAKGRAPLSPGDRVLLVYPPSLHFVLAFVACLRVGLVAVPVYPPDPRKLRKDIQAFSRTAASCRARVALTSSAYDHAKKASNIKAKLTGDDTRWPDGLDWVVSDKALPEATKATRGGPSSSSVTDASPGVARSSLAFLQYTSGSTGDPKGVKITHGNLAHNLSAIVKELRAGEDTIVVSWLPQYHDMGLIGSVLGTLYCGGSGYYISPLDFVRSPPVWIKAIGRYRATHLQAPNFGFALSARKWKALKTQPAVDLSSVVHMINAAEPIDAASMDVFQDTFGPYGLREGVIKPTYGLAEHTVFVCSGGEQKLTVDRRALEVDKQVKLAGEPGTASTDPFASDDSANASTLAWCKLVGCGFPSRVKGMKLLVVDPISLRRLPEDRVGEVWIRSPSKAHGYWGLPARSREAFCAIPSSSSPNANESAVTENPNNNNNGSKNNPGPGGGTLDDIPDGGVSDKGTGDGNPIAAELHCGLEDESVAGGGDEGWDWSTGFVRTGDEGFLHLGELFVCGRIKDLVIVAGRNHYPQDLERTAERGRNETIRPGCSAAFSIPGGGDKGGELLVLTVELREGQVKVSEAQRRMLAEEIRASIVSEHGVDVHHLLLLAPRTNIKTTSGKIARQWCRRAFMEDKMKPLLHLDKARPTEAAMVGAGGSGGGKDTVSTIAVVAAVGGGEKDGGETEVAATDVSTLTDEQLLARLQDALASMGDGSTPSPDAPFYTLGLSSLTAAQFSGLLEQEYGAHVPLAMLDADDVTLRSLVPVVKAGGSSDHAGGRVGAGGVGAGVVAGVGSSETMIREQPGRCEESITNGCPCCLCLLSCPCCR